MKNAGFEHVTLKTPHYVSFLPSKRDTPDHAKPSDNSLNQSSALLGSSNSTRTKDYLNSLKFDIQRTKSPQTSIENNFKYTFPSSIKKEPTVLDMMLGGSKLIREKPEISQELTNNVNNLNSAHSLRTSPNLPFDSNHDIHQSPRTNMTAWEDLGGKGSRMNSEMFDSIMRHIDKKFNILETRLKAAEEMVASQQAERLTDKSNFEKKEKEREASFSQEKQKEKEKFSEELEKKDQKISDLSFKISSLEGKIQLYEEKINRFQNQNETKLSTISSEVQTSLNKFLKSAKEMNSKIELIYETPQVVFQKFLDDQEKIKRNNEDSIILNQKIGLIHDDFREKIKDVNSNLESLAQIIKKNSGDISDQKLAVNKIEEDFFKLLNCYKDLNEEIIKLKSFQDEIFRLKAQQGEIIGHLSGMKTRKKK